MGCAGTTHHRVDHSGSFDYLTGRRCVASTNFLLVEALSSPGPHLLKVDPGGLGCFCRQFSDAVSPTAGRHSRSAAFGSLFAPSMSACPTRMPTRRLERWTILSGWFLWSVSHEVEDSRSASGGSTIRRSSIGQFSRSLEPVKDIPKLSCG